MKKVSIVLPSYNRVNFIGTSIESCLKQTYSNIELIIIDDGSVDGSQDIIKSYASKDSRIIFIQNEVNKKLPGVLNTGFSIATGAYYTWTSDDNYFALDAIEKMVEVLDNCDVGLVYADYTTINDEGKVITRIYQEEPEFLPIRDCVGACFLYRANIAKEVGLYNEKLFMIEDYEYFLRFGLKAKMDHLPESLYFYRLHDGSLTSSKKEQIRQIKNHLKQLFADKYNIPDNLKPINELYLCFIQPRSLKNYLKFISVVIKNPIITLSYIFKQSLRLMR